MTTINTLIKFKEHLTFTLIVLSIFLLSAPNGFIEVACAVVFVVVFAQVVINKDTQILCNNIFFSILMLWIYLIATSLMSANIPQSLSTSLPLIRFVMFAIAVGYALYIYANFQIHLIRAMIFIVLFLSINAIIQFVFGADIFGNKPLVNGNLIRLSNFSEKLRIGIVIATLVIPIFGHVLNLIKSKQYAQRDFSLGLLSVVLAIIAVMLSGERTPFILLIAVCIINASFVLKRRTMLTLAVVSGILIAIIISSSEVLRYRLFEVTVREISTLFTSSSYGMISQNAIFILKQGWLSGFGAKSFQATCLSFDVPFPNYCALHPHNIYIEIMTSGGVVALFILLLILSIIGMKILQYIRTQHHYSFVYTSCVVFIMLKLLPFIPSPSIASGWSSYPIAFICGIIYAYHLRDTHTLRK